jgi:hypothetical protein
VERAVIDSSLRQQLPKRAVVLQTALSGLGTLASIDWRPRVRASVH